MYSVNRHDGYIYGVASGTHLSGEIISREEYERIRAAIAAKPTAPAGYGYRLREDLRWELYELPPGPELPEEATVADYRAALEEMGVSL